MDLFAFMAMMQTLQSCIIWCRENQLLATPGTWLRCTPCDTPITEVPRNKGRQDGTKLRCPKCRREHSIRIGSFFFKRKLGIRELVTIMYLFAYRAPLTFVETVLNKVVSKPVIFDYFDVLRQLCDKWILANPVQLGGAGLVVEIDVFKLKGSKKKRTGVRTPDQFIFGVWDRHLSRGMMWIVPNKCTETLFPIIKTHILPASIIYSNLKPEYDDLIQEGYYHEVVNKDHKFVTVNEHETTIHINSISGWWSNVKRELKRTRKLNYGLKTADLNEIMYRHHRGSGSEDIFENLIHDISDFYPVPDAIE